LETIPTATAEQVRAAMEDLHQLTAAARLYGLAHPKTREVADRLTIEIAELLGELGELELHVRRDGLDIEGVEVFGDDDNKEGIARTLHREGITSFAFLQGLTRNELTTFSELLGLNLGLPQWEEETLSSLLWQAQLQFVAYEAVEHLSDAQELSETKARGEEGYIHEMVRQILDPSAFGGGPVEMMEDGPSEGYAVAGPGMETAEMERAAFVDGEERGSGEAREAMAVPEVAWAPSQQLAALDLTRWAEEPDAELEEEIDLEALRREAAEDTPVAILGRVASLLLVAAARGRDELPTADATAMLTRALERDEASQGNLWRVCMDLALRLADSEVPLLKAGRRGIHAWLERCTRPDMFAAFAGSLSEQRPPDRKLLHRFLTGGDGQRAHLVIQRLGGQAAVARRLGWAMDEVAAVVRSDLDQLTAGLDRRPVDEVLQVVDLLRRMGDEQAVALMRSLMKHPVSDVRAAVIKALPDPLPKPLLTPVMSLLSDDSATVRQAVVDLLRTRKPVGAFDAIQKMVNGSMFANGKPAQKMILATALGAAGGDAAIPALESIMDQYGLLSGPRARPDLEACAAALAVIDTLRARQLLKRGAKSLNPYIRTACREALDGGKG